MRRYRQLCALLDLLMNMSTKDFLDFSLEDEDDGGGELGGGPVMEVIFSGIAIVLPMVSPEMLQVSSLNECSTLLSGLLNFESQINLFLV